MDNQKKSPFESKPLELSLVSTEQSVAKGSVDDAKVLAMGYEPQMNRAFGMIQLIGAAFINTASWLGVAGGFATGVVIGGSACIVYGLIIIAFFNLCIVTALGELVSAMPNSGGQYYWALQLAPRKIARASAFMTGICNLAGGIIAAAGSTVLIGYWIMGCVALFHPNLELHAWQMYLIGAIFYVTCAVLNLYQKMITKTVAIGLAVNVIAYAVILIVPPAVSPSHTSASFIFASVDNVSGWTNPAMAFLVGLINANYAFGLVDTAVHLAEEVPSPERTVPKALYITIIVSFITAWPIAILLMYCMSDFETVVETPTLVPLLELFHLALRNNKIGAVCMLMVILLCGLFALITLQMYQARVCWAFSRDNGLPFSSHFSKVHPKLGVPVQAHIFCVIIVLILSLLCIASSTAFNSLAAGVVVLPSLSYIPAVIFSLLPANKDVKGPFHLGIIGTIAKVLTILFCVFTSIVYCFPFVKPVTGSNMNYLSVILGVIAIYGVVDWVFRARKVFRHQLE